MRTSAGPPVRLNRNGVWTEPGNESPAQAIAPPKRTTNGMRLNRRRRMAAGGSNYAASGVGRERRADRSRSRRRFDGGATWASRLRRRGRLAGRQVAAGNVRGKAVRRERADADAGRRTLRKNFRM